MRMPCHITDERVKNDPQDAPIETRPDGCECIYDDGLLRCAASHHYDENEMCPIYECMYCGHEKRHHGDRGCEYEFGDRYLGKEYEEAGGVCQCIATPEVIVAVARYGSIEVANRIKEGTWNKQQ